MHKKIRFVFTALLGGILLFSCLKKMGRKELEENLKNAMNLHLNQQPRIDTSKVKFNVLEVAFFEDKTVYRCQFKVDMKEIVNNQIKDTVGSMGANISKDFKTVSRIY